MSMLTEAEILEKIKKNESLYVSFINMRGDYIKIIPVKKVKGFLSTDKRDSDIFFRKNSNEAGIKYQQDQEFLFVFSNENEAKDYLKEKIKERISILEIKLKEKFKEIEELKAKYL